MADRTSFQEIQIPACTGHLPKHDDESAKAWLYGKLLVALLVEKVVRHAQAISPRDAASRKKRIRSPWRNFKFALNQVTRAIEPAFTLGQMIEQWDKVSASLTEPPRERSNQVDSHFPLTQTS